MLDHTYTMSLDEWVGYKNILAKLSQRAVEEFRDAVWNINGRWGGVGLGEIPRDELIEYAYALVTKYGEGAAAAACVCYDEIAAMSGVSVPPAVPAPTAKIDEVGKAINGTIKTENEEIISGSVGRLVKRAGQDTTLQNAKRDIKAGAQVAWVPSGDTCAFCVMLASNGWQNVSKKTLKNGHAEHIHANCDCAYGVRFSSSGGVESYDPDVYKDLYYDTDPDATNYKDRLNAMRRKFYAENKDAGDTNIDGSVAEEINVNDL